MNKSKGSRSRPYHHGDLERALVTAALEVIAVEGVEALTLRLVGEKVGVSRTALYRHFDDKAALLVRIAGDGFRRLRETLARVRANASPDARDTLEVMAAAHVHFAQANPSHYAIMFGGFIKADDRYPDLAREMEAAYEELLETVREAQRRGGLGGGAARAIADVMWAVTFGIARLGTSGHLHHPSVRWEELAVLGVRWVSDGCQMGVR